MFLTIKKRLNNFQSLFHYQKKQKLGLHFFASIGANMPFFAMFVAAFASFAIFVTHMVFHFHRAFHFLAPARQETECVNAILSRAVATDFKNNFGPTGPAR